MDVTNSRDPEPRRASPVSSSTTYLLDANVFITAKNSYYAFAICPGFWDGIICHHKTGEIFSIDKVKDELLAGKDDLVEWVKNKLPASFFISTDGSVTSSYRAVISWLESNEQYYRYATAKFAGGADGWLVAHAMVNGFTVVTNEQPRPGKRNAVPLPDVCKHFGVTCVGPFAMLKDLGLQFK